MAYNFTVKIINYLPRLFSRLESRVKKKTGVVWPEMGKITCKMIFIKDQDQLCQRSKIKIKDHFSGYDLRSKIRSFQKITYYINMDVVKGSLRNYALM